jgi:hypothetical protein
MNSSCAQGLNPSLLLLDLTVRGISRLSSVNPGCQFSSLRISPAPKLRSVWNFSWVCSTVFTKETTPPELDSSDSFRDPFHTLPVLDLQHSQTVEVTRTLCTLSHSNPCLPLLSQTAETSTLVCTSPAWLPQPKSTSGQMRIRVQLSGPINALYADEFNCTLCRNVLAQTEKQLKLILLFLSQISNSIMKSHTQHIKANT